MRFSKLKFLESWSVLKTAVIGALMIVLPIVGIYFGLVEPALQEISDLQAQLSQLQERLIRERELFSKRVFLKQNLEVLKKFEALAKTQLPEGKDMPMILSGLENLGNEIGLKVTSFIPQKEQIKEAYAEIPIEVTVEGTFEQIQILVDELGRFNRIINVTDIKISEPRGYALEGKVQVNGILKISAFRQLTDAERNAVDKKIEQEQKHKGHPSAQIETQKSLMVRDF